jgi:DNA-binding transcriptional LysR family regulator
MNRSDKFDLNLLRAFDAVWRHGRLGPACRELNISQPALSHSLKRLREQLGDPLFLKVPNGMQPTARAKQLAPAVQSALSNIHDAIFTAPCFDPKSATRTFTLAMSDLSEVGFLPRLMSRLMSDAPSIKIRSVSLVPQDLMPAMQTGSVDLAIGYFPHVDSSDILQQFLFEDSYVCVARAGHPSVQGLLTTQQFRELPHAVVNSATRTPGVVEGSLRKYKVDGREVLHSSHFLSIPMIIASTDLVVLVPESVGEMFSRFMDLQVLPPPFPIPSFDIKQYWHRTQHADAGNRWLRGIVTEMFRRSTNEPKCPAVNGTKSQAFSEQSL